MKKRKYTVIDMFQENLIVCDNLTCDYVIPNPNPTGEVDNDLSEFINMPCPKCGDNLLKTDDYKSFKKILKTINWVNKWFGWLGYFSKEKPNSKVLKISNK